MKITLYYDKIDGEYTYDIEGTDSENCNKKYLREYKKDNKELDY